MSSIRFGSPQPPSSSSENSLWTLVRDLNAAKVNKEALDCAIEEEEALMELLHRIDAFVVGSPQGRTRNGAPQQLMSTQQAAFRLIDDETQRMHDEINRIKQIKRDESKEVSDAEGIGISLGLQLKAADCASSVEEPLASLEELRSAVDNKRASCHKWLKEQQSLSVRVAELRTQNAQLEQECVDVRERTGTLEGRQTLLQQVAKLEASVDTLVKLISIAPSPVRSARR